MGAGISCRHATSVATTKHTREACSLLVLETSLLARLLFVNTLLLYVGRGEGRGERGEERGGKGRR